MSIKKLASCFLCLGLFVYSLNLQATTSNNSILDLVQNSAKYLTHSDEPGACSFTPPEGWQIIDPASLPSQVKILVKGQGQSELPPSLNLAIEEVDVDLATYLRTIRRLHETSGETQWKRLGVLQTESGPATLTELESKSQWGSVRMMQAIILRNQSAYLLTATALKEEFPQFYKEFFQAIQSIKINEDLFAAVKDSSKRAKLKKAYDDTMAGWIEAFDQTEVNNSDLSKEELAEKTFQDNDFQYRTWKKFQSFVAEEFENMDAEWQDHFISKTQEKLLHAR